MQVRDQLTNAVVEDIPESQVGIEYQLALKESRGDLGKEYDGNEDEGNDQLNRLSRTTPYYKVCSHLVWLLLSQHLHRSQAYLGIGELRMQVQVPCVALQTPTVVSELMHCTWSSVLDPKRKLLVVGFIRCTVRLHMHVGVS